MTVRLNPEIFREYDVRGVAERDLTDPVVQGIGAAFAGYLQPMNLRSVAIGYDARTSSPRLRDALARGLNGAGLDVIDVGLCPTPALYFTMHHLNPGAGIMVTGSHNPAEFNGFKLCVDKGTIYGAEIQKLRVIMEKDSFPTRDTGRIIDSPIVSAYLRYLKGLFPVSGPEVRVVLDSGNGTAGLAAPALLRAMGCEVIELYSEPDGRFPNHHPDPTIPGNLADLMKAVSEHHADLGIAFDGDADRIGVVDEQGSILWGDQLMVLFSRDILRDRPGSTFVSEVKCSQTLYDDIRAHGGNAIMWKAGHSLIKAKMKEAGAILAGEMSGHIFFADRYFGYDDAIYASARVIEILQRERRKRGDTPLSSLLSDLPKTFSTPEIRFDCPDAVKFKVVDGARELFLRDDLSMQPREVITVDGVRAIFRDGWGLIRASNTQPVLVMRFEAQSAESLRSIREFMEGQVRSIIAGLGRVIP
jgi:phosphomannomutase/phosphoglucomutase